MARIRKDRKGGDNSFYSSRIVRNRREFEDNDANLNLETGIKKKDDYKENSNEEC